MLKILVAGTTRGLQKNKIKDAVNSILKDKSVEKLMTPDSNSELTKAVREIAQEKSIMAEDWGARSAIYLEKVKMLINETDQVILFWDLIWSNEGKKILAAALNKNRPVHILSTEHLFRAQQDAFEKIIHGPVVRADTVKEVVPMDANAHEALLEIATS